MRSLLRVLRQWTNATMTEARVVEVQTASLANTQDPMACQTADKQQTDASFMTQAKRKRPIGTIKDV